MYDTREVEGMVKVAICDDDESVIQNMENILEEYAHEHEIKLEFGMFYNGEHFAQYMNKNGDRFDIIFLDIEMKGINGIETARRIREIDKKTLIIYVTSHESYALEAYEVHPFHFLVKPLNKEAVQKCFEQAYNHISPEEQYFDFSYKKNRYREDIKNIMYFMSYKRVIQIHMQNGEVLEFYGKLDDVEMKLMKGRTDFWRIHKSILVNSLFIFRKTFSYVELTNGEQLGISKKYAKEMNTKYLQTIKKQMEE